jgi:hypothetical protein
MRTAILLLGLICLTASAFGQLTQADIDRMLAEGGGDDGGVMYFEGGPVNNLASAARVGDNGAQPVSNPRTFEIGLNGATNYPLSELTGLRLDLQKASPGVPQYLFPEKAADPLPAYFNWLDQNGCTAVRDQGQCGSCWSFASIGVFESIIRIVDGTQVDLSEQMLVSCDSQSAGCDGGWEAFNFLMDYGVSLESSFPYQAADVACNSGVARPYAIDAWGYVGSYQGIPSVEAIKQAIIQYGPVWAGVYADENFQAYKGGVFNYWRGYAVDPNHAIVLVGWDDSKGSWILRNSWDDTWGIGGYMFIRYDAASVGYGACCITAYSGGSVPDDPLPDDPLGNLTISNTVAEGSNIEVYVDGQYVATLTMYYPSVEDTPDCRVNDESTVSLDLPVGEHIVTAYQTDGYWEFTATVTEDYEWCEYHVLVVTAGEDLSGEECTTGCCAFKNMDLTATPKHAAVPLVMAAVVLLVFRKGRPKD